MKGEIWLDFRNKIRVILRQIYFGVTCNPSTCFSVKSFLRSITPEWVECHSSKCWYPKHSGSGYSHCTEQVSAPHSANSHSFEILKWFVLHVKQKMRLALTSAYKLSSPLRFVEPRGCMLCWFLSLVSSVKAQESAGLVVQNSNENAEDCRTQVFIFLKMFWFYFQFTGCVAIELIRDSGDHGHPHLYC